MDQSEKDYQAWKHRHTKILREMYEDGCNADITFDEYCRLTFQSLEQTETFQVDFGLDVNID